ncbi:MAG: hypothetical protein AAF752_05480 [Bacteroidota bacterium]
MRRAFASIRSTAAGWMVLGLALMAQPASAQPTVEETFDQALEAYEAGEYARALTLFEQIEDAGLESGPLYYNIGNAHFRLGQLGPAVLNYERARRHIPLSEELQHSAEIARRQTQNDVPFLPRPFWVQWWTWLVAHLHPIGLFYIGFSFYLVTAILVGYRIHLGRPHAWARRIGVLTGLFGLLFLAAAWLASARGDVAPSAVVMQSNVTVRTQPDLDAGSSETIHEGLLIDIVDRADDWLYIYLPDGTTGWIPAAAVEEI